MGKREHGERWYWTGRMDVVHLGRGEMGRTCRSGAGVWGGGWAVAVCLSLTMAALDFIQYTQVF